MRLNSGPTAKRARWGTTRPTQPMMPAMLTAVAVMSVDAVIVTAQILVRFTPRERASSSPVARTVSGQRTA